MKLSSVDYGHAVSSSTQAKGVLFTAFDLVQLVIYQINTSKVVLIATHLFDMIGLSLIVML